MQFFGKEGNDIVPRLGNFCGKLLLAFDKRPEFAIFQFAHLLAMNRGCDSGSCDRRVVGLGQKVFSSFVDGSRDMLQLVPLCSHDHRDIAERFRIFNQLQGLPAAHPGHENVEKHHLAGILRQMEKSFLP